MKLKLRFKSEFFLLGLILIVSLLVRLYKIDQPIAAWHSWRQADTAAVARNFYKEGFNPFLPKYDEMSAVSQIPKVNLSRFRLVEFPIYPSLVYFSYLINGGVKESLARLVSIAFSLGSLIFIFVITRSYFDRATALLASLLFGILPYSIFYSSVILPEPSLVFFCLGMFYFTNRWILKNSLGNLAISVLFTSLAFLTKPMAIFYLLPLTYLLYLKKENFLPKITKSLIFLSLALTPFILWRIWINQHPEGIPASDWLFNGNGIRFKPAFWRWIIGDRFGREILSPVGTFLFILGLLIKPSLKETKLLHLLALSLLLYLVVFATGNVQHDYYQVLIVPALVIFASRGAISLLRGFPGFLPRLWTIPLSVFFLGLTILLTWNEVKGLYQINNYTIVTTGKRADQLLPNTAIVIAPYSGDTAFLYQINRPGFAIIGTSIVDMVERFGVTHYVSTSFDSDTNFVLENYQTIERTPEYLIADLTKKLK